MPGVQNGTAVSGPYIQSLLSCEESRSKEGATKWDMEVVFRGREKSGIL